MISQHADANANKVYAAVTFAKAANSGRPFKNEKLIPATLVGLPGYGLTTALKELAEASEMEYVEIRMAQIEYHPGAMDLEISVPIERAVATNKPLMIVLDEAHNASPGLLAAAAKIIKARVTEKTSVLFALTSAEKEQVVRDKIASSLEIDQELVLNGRFLNGSVTV